MSHDRHLGPRLLLTHGVVQHVVVASATWITQATAPCPVPPSAQHVQPPGLMPAALPHTCGAAVGNRATRMTIALQEGTGRGRKGAQGALVHGESPVFSREC